MFLTQRVHSGNTQKSKSELRIMYFCQWSWGSAIPNRAIIAWMDGWVITYLAVLFSSSDITTTDMKLKRCI